MYFDVEDNVVNLCLHSYETQREQKNSNSSVWQLSKRTPSYVIHEHSDEWAVAAIENEGHRCLKCEEFLPINLYHQMLLRTLS